MSSREMIRKQLLQRGLTRISTFDRPFRRLEMFGRFGTKRQYERAEVSLLQALTAEGILESLQTHPRAPYVYRVKDTLKYQKLLQSEEEQNKICYYKARPVEPQASAPPLSVTEPLVTPEKVVDTDTQEEEPSDEVSDATFQILITLKTLAENIVFVRNKLLLLEQRVTHTEQVASQLLDMWTTK